MLSEVLRQRLDVEEELERTRTLDAKYELDVDACSVRQRRCERDRSSVPTAVERATHRLIRRFLERGSLDRDGARRCGRASRREACCRIRDAADDHRARAYGSQVGDSTRAQRADVDDAEPQLRYRPAGRIHKPTPD